MPLPEPEREAEPVKDGVSVADTLKLTLAVTLSESVSDAVCETLCDSVTEPVPLRVVLVLAVPVGELRRESVGEPEVLGQGVAEGEPLPERDARPEAL